MECKSYHFSLNRSGVGSIGAVFYILSDVSELDTSLAAYSRLYCSRIANIYCLNISKLLKKGIAFGGLSAKIFGSLPSMVAPFASDSQTATGFSE